MHYFQILTHPNSKRIKSNGNSIEKNIEPFYTYIHIQHGSHMTVNILKSHNHNDI